MEVRQSETDVLPMSHPTNSGQWTVIFVMLYRVLESAHVASLVISVRKKIE